MFYFKLAFTNLRKNYKLYNPFLFSMVFIFILNLVIQIISKNPGLSSLEYARGITKILTFGIYILFIFSVIFVFYMHSQLIKERKKELGLYSILGLGKRELKLMLFCESIIQLVITIVTGLILGVIFAKLLFLILRKVIEAGNEIDFFLSPSSIVIVSCLFLFIFLLLYLTDIVQLRKVRPINLLQESREGEKEPKTRWILSIVGFICLIAGYTIALTIKDIVKTVPFFFMAVVLVIIGTYCLFTAGSIFILKILKHNKTYYYQPKHFVYVSNMLYRMKQNGVGLASICVLSTMVMVTISMTAALYFGIDSSIEEQYVYDVVITSRKFGKTEFAGNINSIAKQNDVSIKDYKEFQTFDTVQYSFDNKNKLNSVQNGATLNIYVNYMTLSDYNRLEDKNDTLNNNEVIVISRPRLIKDQEIDIQDTFFQIKEVTRVYGLYSTSDLNGDTITIVMQNEKQIEDIAKSNRNYAEGSIDSIVFNLEGENQNRLQFLSEIDGEIDKSVEENHNLNGNIYVSSKDNARLSQLSLIGGFLFIGCLLGVSFTLAMVLIIYYKQLSEGYADRQRYDVLQKVGMSQQEVEQTIRSQVLSFFLFPILVACIHICFAMPILNNLFLYLSSAEVLRKVTLIVVLIFIVIYLFVYWITSKVYYNEVKRKRS